MNQVNLIGRLTKDPEVRYSSDGLAVAAFTLAVNRMKEGADFPRIIAFGKTAELIEKYMEKGKQIGLSGRIQTGSYKNKEGQTVYTTDVVAERIYFIGSKNEKTPDQTQDSDIEIEGFAQLDDDIPF